MHCGIWILAGLLTVWLMYGRKEHVPVFKALLVTLFGWLSLIVWCVANIGKSVPNPFFKSPAPQKPLKK